MKLSSAFSFTVEMTVKGPVDPNTGMIMNITDMKNIINKVVMDVYDHKNIDLDVPFFL